MLLDESVGARLELMPALIIYLHDYDVLVLVLGDGRTGDWRGYVILSRADAYRVTTSGFLGGERTEGSIGWSLVV